MTPLNRTLWYCLIVAVVVGGMTWLSPNLDRGPKGLFLPTVQRTYPPENQPAALLESMPARAEVIGRVSIEQYAPRPNVRAKKASLAYAVQLAQLAGGTGFLVTNLQYISPQEEGVAGMAKYLLTGWVVRG